MQWRQPATPQRAPLSCLRPDTDDPTRGLVPQPASVLMLPRSWCPAFPSATAGPMRQPRLETRARTVAGSVDEEGNQREADRDEHEHADDGAGVHWRPG